MAAFYGLCLALFLVMRYAPSTRLGAWLNRHLVAAPLARLADMKRHRLIYIVLLVAMMLAGGEMILLLGPEVLATYAVYLDAFLVTYALTAAAMARNSLRYTRLRVRKGGRVRGLLTGRRRRQRPAERVRPSANDDDGPVALPLAA
jgi:hypothetical protein